MKLQTVGKLMISIGLIVILYAINMPVSINNAEVINIHLLNERQNTLIIGGMLFIAGIVLFSVFKLKQTKEEELEEKQKRADIRQSAERHLIDITKSSLGPLNSAINWVQSKTDKIWSGRLIRFALGCVFGVCLYWAVFKLIFFVLLTNGREDLYMLAGAVGVAMFITAIVYLFIDRSILKAFRNLLVIYLLISIVTLVLVWVVYGRSEGLNMIAEVLVSSMLLAATLIELSNQKT